MITNAVVPMPNEAMASASSGRPLEVNMPGRPGFAWLTSAPWLTAADPAQAPSRNDFGRATRVARGAFIRESFLTIRPPCAHRRCRILESSLKDHCHDLQNLAAPLALRDPALLPGPGARCGPFQGS